MTALPSAELAALPRRRRGLHEPRVDAHIGARLKLRRRLLGLSQSDLARELDVTYQQVCKYEAGENRISAAKLFLAADILSCSIGFFFEGLSRKTPTASPQRSDDAERLVSQFLSRSDTLRLTGEFPKIRSRRLRRNLMRLVSYLAEEGGGDG